MTAKITFYRSMTDSEFSSLKASLKALPFQVSVRRPTQRKFEGGVHILPHKSSSPNRRWTDDQFNAVRAIVKTIGLSETGSRFIDSENASYILAGGLWYLMMTDKEIQL